MATTIAVALQDDRDGRPADERLRSGPDGAEYQIDLSTKNARAFGSQLASFAEHARKAARAQGRRSARASPRGERSGDIRARANDNGIPVSARGRIPASVAEQYQTAAR